MVAVLALKCLQVQWRHRWQLIPPEESGKAARGKVAFPLSLEGPQPREQWEQSLQESCGRTKSLGSCGLEDSRKGWRALEASQERQVVKSLSNSGFAWSPQDLEVEIRAP